MGAVLEVSQMGIPQMGQDSFCGLDAISQMGHFSGLADPCFHQRKVMVSIQRPKTQGHTELAVVAQRTSVDRQVRRKDLRQPFFCDGLPIASCDGQDRPFELEALVLRHGLHHGQHVGDHHHVGGGTPSFL